MKKIVTKKELLILIDILKLVNSHRIDAILDEKNFTHEFESTLSDIEECIDNSIKSITTP